MDLHSMTITELKKIRDERREALWEVERILEEKQLAGRVKRGTEAKRQMKWNQEPIYERGRSAKNSVHGEWQ